jgi:ribonuclease E
MSDETIDQGLPVQAQDQPQRLPRPAPQVSDAAGEAPKEPSRPKIGDSRPAPVLAEPAGSPPPNGSSNGTSNGEGPKRRRRRGGRGRGGGSGSSQRPASQANGEARPNDAAPKQGGAANRPPRPAAKPAAAPRARAPRAEAAGEETEESSAGSSRRRRGRERKGRPVGRYLMCVHVEPEVTQIAVLEGRSLIEHHVERAEDDANQIDGNIYRGRVKNVLPGMEAAFVDIGTPKNAVLYWGDVQFDSDDIGDREPGATRIEHLLRPGQSILCQVTKNPIGLKGARLTQEVSLPGRFVVLVPNSDASGISKRLDDRERRRLRSILDEIRPAGHGVIVRTAAEGVDVDELRRDVESLVEKWTEIEEKAKRLPSPSLLYSEPHLALRAIREELNEEYRGIVIDDFDLFNLVRAYVADIDPELADRVEYYDTAAEGISIFERNHVHEQLHKALDRKVWLPSGGSLIIERTEALTVIDVNTGKNVGSSNLEETVFQNNLEAAEEIARQLRLRDIGGIIVIDFIDMEIKSNRADVAATLRQSLSRDKTPTQIFDISELGLVEMTRKRIGEGLVESLSHACPMCEGRGIVFTDIAV